ncbi:MAG TPA: hypothetical protein VEI46_09445 [Thermodesulfovibrionales bacterium]|nr:hypothetical protein [Thermodesulfovibrionales bacterium]
MKVVSFKAEGNPKSSSITPHLTTIVIFSLTTSLLPQEWGE